MIPLWNVEELEAVLPDDCRVERESARIDVRRGRVTTRIMDRLTGGDGVLASRHPKTKIRDDGDTFLAGLHESMLGRWRSLCHWRSELSADPVRVFVHWLECETAYVPYRGEANRLYRHMADILERTFLKSRQSSGWRATSERAKRNVGRGH